MGSKSWGNSWATFSERGEGSEPPWETTHTEVASWDGRNAFNSMNHGAVLKAIRKHMPKLLPWYIFTHSGEGARQFDNKGVEYARRKCMAQGSPLAPLFWALGALEPFEKVTRRYAERNVHGVGGIACIDDFITFGDLEFTLSDENMQQMIDDFNEYMWC